MAAVSESSNLNGGFLGVRIVVSRMLDIVGRNQLGVSVDYLQTRFIWQKIFCAFEFVLGKFNKETSQVIYLHIWIICSHLPDLVTGDCCLCGSSQATSMETIDDGQIRHVGVLPLLCLSRSSLVGRPAIGLVGPRSILEVLWPIVSDISWFCWILGCITLGELANAFLEVRILWLAQLEYEKSETFILCKLTLLISVPVGPNCHGALLFKALIQES